MTRKDYDLIATAIAQSISEVGANEPAHKAVSSIVEHLCHGLQIDNQRFDPRRFKLYIAKLTAGKHT